MRAHSLYSISAAAAGVSLRLLHGTWFSVTGIDPQADTIVAARKAMPQLRFEIACTEALPFSSSSFDAAIFLNSSHHVGDGRMHAALLEAGRVLVFAGSLIVIEPRPSRSFFEVMKPLDDQTEIRDKADVAIRFAVERGSSRLMEKLEYDRDTFFIDVDALSLLWSALTLKDKAPLSNSVRKLERPSIAKPVCRRVALYLFSRFQCI